MFEKAKPVPQVNKARFSGSESLEDDLLLGSVEPVLDDPAQGGGALRLIEWNELTARLAASRDLRRVLRHDSQAAAKNAGGSFADAAAYYFREREEDERSVNPVALERSKGSSPMGSNVEGESTIAADKRGHADKGDARED